MTTIYDGNYVKRYYKQFYVGLKEQQEMVFDKDSGANVVTDTYLLGFATPFENNKAFEKRQKTVDYWAQDIRRWDPVSKRNVHKPALPPQIIDNIPRSTFEIINLIRRAYRTNNVLWRVNDPRGFELEITSENLSMILDEVGILKGGVIANDCVWVRIGPQNHLIPEGCKIWNEVVIPALNYIEE